MKSTKLIIADDHKLFADTLSKVLSDLQEIKVKVVGIANDGIELIHLISRIKADLILLDLNMPGRDGFSVLPEIKELFPDTKILVVTMYQEEKFIKKVFELGADGYFIKGMSLSHLVDAIGQVLEGNIYLPKGMQIFPKKNGDEVKKETNGIFEDDYIIRHNLTKREIEILHLISSAKSNKEIAQELFISDQTVRVHRKNIMRKLGVSNTASLIKFALDHSLIQ